jgi:hypothetical protein
VEVRYDPARWNPESLTAAMRNHLRPPYLLLGCDAEQHVGAR